MAAGEVDCVALAQAKFSLPLEAAVLPQARLWERGDRPHLASYEGLILSAAVRA